MVTPHLSGSSLLHLFRKLVLPLLLAAGLLTAPSAAHAATGVTVLCSSTSYSCLAGTGYTGQSVWGSWGPGDNCVSYAAYRLSQTGPKPWSGTIGNGSDWDEKARAVGIRVDSTPAVGSIAQWDGGAGHVAYVEVVTATYIEVSEDNYQTDTTGYSSRRRLDRSGTTFLGAEFIHVRDAVTPAPGTANGGSTITGVASGRCIDVTGAGTANGTRPQLYDCNPGAAQQQWIFDYGQLRVYGNYTKCLDADANAGGANGTIIQIFDCTGGSNQLWTFAPGGAIRSTAYGRCLDAAGAGTANGTQFQLYDCHGGDNQAWIGGPTPNGGGAITNAASGRCIDIPGASITLGVKPQLFDCNGGSQQQWRLVGSQLKVYSDKCLDVAGAGTANGTAVQTWYCTGTPWQQWTLAADGTIRSVHSGRCLDAIGGGTANGTQLQIYDCNSAPWQSWTKLNPL